MSTPRLPDPIGSVPAPPGTLVEVLATARRKRLRRLQLVGGTGAAVLLATVLAVNLGGGPPTDSLGVTDGGGAIATTADEPAPTCTPFTDPGEPGVTHYYCGETPTADPSANPNEPAPTAAPGESGGTDPTPPAPTARPRPTEGGPYPTPYPTTYSSATPAPHPTKSLPPEPTYSPRPEPTVEPSQDARGEMRRTYVEGNVQCSYAADQRNDWCAVADTPSAGRPLEFVVRACRSADAGPGQLETGPPGADFEVYDGGALVWRWSSGQAFPAVMMSLDVQPGDCIQWATTWNGVDDANNRRDAGRYDGVAYVTAEPVRAPMKFVITLS